MAPSAYGSDPNYSDVTHTALGERFESWLKRDLGIAQSPLHSLENDDDWTFVLKMHAFVEAGLTHLVTTKLGNPNIRDVISELPTSDNKKGKVAFVKAYDLLPDDCRSFIKLLSEIRNDAVHDAQNLNLDLKRLVSKVKGSQQLDRWKRAFSSWWVPLPIPNEAHQNSGKRVFETALDDPRHSIFACVIHILAMANVTQINADQNRQFFESFPQSAE